MTRVPRLNVAFMMSSTSATPNCAGSQPTNPRGEKKNEVTHVCGVAVPFESTTQQHMRSPSSLVTALRHAPSTGSTPHARNRAGGHVASLVSRADAHTSANKRRSTRILATRSMWWAMSMGCIAAGHFIARMRLLVVGMWYVRGDWGVLRRRDSATARRDDEQVPRLGSQTLVPCAKVNAVRHERDGPERQKVYGGNHREEDEPI